VATEAALVRFAAAALDASPPRPARLLPPDRRGRARRHPRRSSAPEVPTRCCSAWRTA
jgi:hypothetical protein